jgi:hypothetical protein
MSSRRHSPGRAQRHLLDEAQFVAALQAEPRQGDHVLLVGAAQDDRVDLDRAQARLVGGEDPRQDVVEPVSAGQLRVACAIEGVQRDVHAIEPGPRQAVDATIEPQAVGGQCQLRAPGRTDERRGSGDDALQAATQQRLAAGEADAGDAAVLHRDADEAHDLVVGESLLGRQPGEAFGGHAVAAP